MVDDTHPLDRWPRLESNSVPHEQEIQITALSHLLITNTFPTDQPCFFFLHFLENKDIGRYLSIVLRLILHIDQVYWNSLFPSLPWPLGLLPSAPDLCRSTTLSRFNSFMRPLHTISCLPLLFPWPWLPFILPLLPTLSLAPFLSLHPLIITCFFPSLQVFIQSPFDFHLIGITSFFNLFTQPPSFDLMKDDSSLASFSIQPSLHCILAYLYLEPLKRSRSAICVYCTVYSFAN